MTVGADRVYNRTPPSPVWDTPQIWAHMAARVHDEWSFVTLVMAVLSIVHLLRIGEAADLETPCRVSFYQLAGHWLPPHLEHGVKHGAVATFVISPSMKSPAVASFFMTEPALDSQEVLISPPAEAASENGQSQPAHQPDGDKASTEGLQGKPKAPPMKNSSTTIVECPQVQARSKYVPAAISAGALQASLR